MPSAMIRQLVLSRISCQCGLLWFGEAFDSGPNDSHSVPIGAPVECSRLAAISGRWALSNRMHQAGTQ